MDISTSKYGHLKYTIKLADVASLGAVTSGDLTIDTLPSGLLVMGYSIKPPAIWAGPSLSVATLRPKLNSTAKGAGTTDVFGNTNGIVDVTLFTDLFTAVNVLKLSVALTGCNANALTVAQADFIINFTVLAP